MTTGMTLPLRKDSPLHARLLEELSSRITMAEGSHSKQWTKWDQADKNVNCYVPENSDDAKRRTARDNDGRPAYTTIMIPYTYALLMAAHTYWTSVFFGRSPVHQYAGRNGTAEQQTQCMEALIAYQVDIGGMLGPYYLWAYDAGKYGVGILGTVWADEVSYVTQLIQNPENPDKPDDMVYSTQPIPGYSGNRVYNVSPWDFLPDPRVPVGRFQEGEFLAVYRQVSWHELKRRERQGFYVNIDEIPATGANRTTIGGEWLMRPESPSLIGYSNQKKPAWVGAFEVYVTLCPKEWGLGTSDWDEKWVFTVLADKTLIIGAQPLGFIHNRYPFDVWEPEPEAYGLWNRGLPEIIQPVQNTMDWLVNSHFFNVRAIANGRFIADPSRIDLSQLEAGEPGWIAALRPEAWGSGVKVDDVFQQVQMGDPTVNHFNDFQNMFQIGERATGINDQMFGALSGGRKTATEVRTATGFGVNRLKTSSEYMSAKGFAQHSQMLVQNSQQYYRGELKVRIVGDLLLTAGPGFLKATPESISGFYDFVPVDGTLPVDRFAQATLWKDLMGQMVRFPQLMMQYDMGKIFEWVSSLAGLKNLNQFKVQVAPDQALAAQAAAGNVIPYQQKGGARPASGPGTQTNVAATPGLNVAAGVG